MKHPLHPDIYLDNIYGITEEVLAARGINTLLFDIDDTLVANYTPAPCETVIDYIAGLQKGGIFVILISNNTKERVEAFNGPLGLPAIYKADKPLGKKLRRILLENGRDLSAAALAGDQLFTDVLCARLAGIKSILIKPIAPLDTRFFRFKRRVEKPIIAAFLRKQKQEDKHGG